MKRSITIKLPEEDLEKLTARAVAAGVGPSTYARQLVAAALGGEPPPAPSALAAPTEELRAAVWALIVALSRDMDEDTANKFLRDYFDRATAFGYARPAGATP